MSERTKYLFIGIVLGAIFSSAIIYFTMATYQGQTAKYWYNEAKIDFPFRNAYNSMIYCLAHIPIYTMSDNSGKRHNVNDLIDVANCVKESAE